MNKSSSARGIPPIPPIPITRRRQSLTFYNTNKGQQRGSVTWQCSVEQWDIANDGENGGSGTTTNTFIGRSLRDAIRELSRPNVQLCFGASAAASDAFPSHTCCPPGPPPFPLSRRIFRSHSPSASAILDNALALAAPHLHFHSHHQLSANRSPSVSGASIAPGMGGRRGSERVVGRLERSNSLLGGRGGGSSHLPFLPELNPQQVANLRRSWKHVNTKGLYDVIRRAFRRVESSNPNARSAFRQNDSHQPPIGTKKQQNIALGEDSSGMLHPRCPTAQRQHSQQQPTSSSSTMMANSTGAMASPSATGCGVMEHTRYFMILLDRIIDGDQEDAEKELRLVGARHVPAFEQFALGVAELERLGEAVAESFFKLDGIRQSKETTKVWRMLIAHIIDHVRDGFETELRMHRRRTSAMLAAGGDSPAVIAMAPLVESKYCKRNSIPSPQQRKQSSYSSQSSSTSSAANPGAFLRAELANLTRKLSNL